MNPIPTNPVHPVAPTWPVVLAPTHWRHIDFISDLHLQASDPATYNTWQHYLQTTRADAVFILGDLFEVWVGDDAAHSMAVTHDQAPSFEASCAQVLKSASRRLDIFFMHGNRDFLLGATFAKASGMTLLNDPCALDFDGQRWLLSHGDALCLDDTDYLRFRAQVRSAKWQQEFLAKPLPERQEIARALRLKSESRKHSGVTYADVDSQAACDWLNHAQANTLIHGHTHKPANHKLMDTQSKIMHRIVLSDWDASATPARAEILRLSRSPLHSTGSTVESLSADLSA